jgi:hypothetical protein
MGYKLLGMVMWRGGKWLLRGRYGKAMAPKPVLAAGGVLLLGLAALFAARGRISGG